MILYHAISTYQILEIILHRRKYHQQEKAAAILPDFIISKHNDYFQLVQLGFFDEVYLFPYLQIQHEEQYIVKMTGKAYEACIPYDITHFDKIYVAGAHFYFSLYLIEQKCKFTMFEDAPGIINNWETLYPELREIYPVHAQIAAENNLFNGMNPLVSQIIVLEKNRRIHKSQMIFDVQSELDYLDKEFMNGIFRFFHIETPKKASERKVILLTERFSQIGRFTESEQIEFYQFFIEKYLDEKELIIKPHPDETVNYAELFPEALVLQESFPSELMPYIFDKMPESIVTFNSTSKENLRKKFVVKSYDLERIMGERNEGNRSNTGSI